MPKFQVRLGYVGHETYIQKKLVWVVSNYINMLGCVDANLTNFFSVLNFANLLECGVRKPLNIDETQTHYTCLIHKSITNFLSCNILCVYV